MGYTRWIIIAVIVVLPIIASFAIIPSDASPDGVGSYFNGIIQYWKQVVSEIDIPMPTSLNLPSF